MDQGGCWGGRGGCGGCGVEQGMFGWTRGVGFRTGGCGAGLRMFEPMEGVECIEEGKGGFAI